MNSSVYVSPKNGEAPDTPVPRVSSAVVHSNLHSIHTERDRLYALESALRADQLRLDARFRALREAQTALYQRCPHRNQTRVRDFAMYDGTEKHCHDCGRVDFV